MGQYYKAIILADKETSNHEVIRIYISPFNSGNKLIEHSYINNKFVTSFEALLTPEGFFYKSRVVWAGDYADNEKHVNKNLYMIADEQEDKEFNSKLTIKNCKEYKYIINHTKKEFVNKDNHILFHPLPLLTAEGNGSGSGDYYGKNQEYIGIWSRDVISVEKEKPDNYIEFICEFSEK
jgi:hypothetical protein